MARFISDMNKVLGVHESGTYGTPMAGSAFWLGQVTSHSVDDQENKQMSHYLGTATRNYDIVDLGVRDVTGTISYRNQNFMLPMWAVGSVAQTGSATAGYTWTASEINTSVIQSAFTSGPYNPPFSFTIEDSKQSPGNGRNFVRTIKGVVPTRASITATQGEVVTTELEYIGQTLVFSSGTTTSGAVSSTTPYIFGNTSLTLAGSAVTAKEVTFEINQNVTGPHYLDGSRDISVPFPGNRDYMLNVTLDLDSTTSAIWYNQYYKTGSTFNAVLDFNRDVTGTGSQHAIFTFSGCNIISMGVPSEAEGVTEATIEVVPQTISITEYTQNRFLPY